MDWILALPFAICRIGHWNASTGPVDITREMFASILACFAEDRVRLAEADQPSLRFGHPKLLEVNESPRVGRFLDLWIDGDILMAKAEFDPDQKAELESGRWPGRSIGLCHNTITGQTRMDHVAILGASQPGVPGMDPIQFAAGKPGAFSILFTGDYRFPGAQPNPKKEIPIMAEKLSLLARLAKTFGVTEQKIVQLAADGEPEPVKAEEPVQRKDDFETVWQELGRISDALNKCVEMCQEIKARMEAYDAKETKPADDPAMSKGAAPTAELSANVGLLVRLKQISEDDAKDIIELVGAMPADKQDAYLQRIVTLAAAQPAMALLSKPIMQPAKGDGKDPASIFKARMGRDPKDAGEAERFIKRMSAPPVA